MGKTEKMTEAEVLGAISLLEDRVQQCLSSWNSLFALSIIGEEILPLLSRTNLDGTHSYRIVDYKRRFREMGQLASSTFQKVQFSDACSEEKLQEIMSDIFSSADAGEFFVKVCSRFLTSKAGTAEIAKRTEPLFVKLPVLPHVIAGNGDSGKAVSGSEHWYKLRYRFRQALNSNLLYMAFLGALEREILNEESIFRFISSLRLFRDDAQALVFRHALSGMLSGDYVSAVHILVPLFENVVIRKCEALGLDTVSLASRSGKGRAVIQNRTVGSGFVLSNEFVRCFGEDFSEQLDSVLFDELGSRIRHKVAHGEMDFLECTPDLCFLMLYFYASVAIRPKMPD